jgi:hypothetical protein
MGRLSFDRSLLEVAEDAGLTHETYYRALASLGAWVAIKRTGRTIHLIAGHQHGDYGLISKT